MNLQLNRVELNVGTFKMPNNLELMIRKSGMLRKDVATQMSIRPETVSRHCSGALAFSIDQAKLYSAIIGCTPQDILFSQNAVPLFGRLDDDFVTVCDLSDGETSYHVPFPADDNMRFVISEHSQQNKKWANGRMYMFNNKAILEQKIDDKSFMRLCIFKIANDNNIRFGVVYPEPGRTFSIGFNKDSHSSTDGVVSLGAAAPHTEVQNHLNLVWCTPILNCLMQPDLLGVVLKAH